MRLDVAVISHRLWQTRFGGDRSVVGRFIQLNDTPTQVVGVMPPGFRFVYHDIDVWVPLQLDRNAPWRESGGRFINVVARVKAGTDIATARADMEQVAGRLASIHEFNKNSTARLVPLREELTGQVEASLIVLYIAVGVLLAIACFNIANLLIARAASRRQEIAIRTSLGAERGSIVRQLLVESMLLALAGGTLGIVLARSSLDALVAFAPPALLGGQELTIDARVLVYVAGLSVLTGLVAGLAPSVIVARRSIVESLHATSSRVTHSPRIRQALVVGQVAMTVVLLCGAALLVRTVMALTSANHGFEQQGLLTMQVSLPGTRYPIERQVAFQQELLTAIRAAARRGFGWCRERLAGDRRSAGRHEVSSAVDTGRPAHADVERDDPGRRTWIFPDAAYSSAARTRVYARRRCESDAGIHRQPGVRRSISSKRGPASRVAHGAHAGRESLRADYRRRRQRWRRIDARRSTSDDLLQP